MVQGLCELGLVGGGPLLGELARGEQAMRRMWPTGVVVDAPVFGEHLGLEHGGVCRGFR